MTDIIEQDENRPALRGFAAMDPEKQRAFASAGGKAAHASGAAHEWSAEAAREAGAKGGKAIVERLGSEHMAAIGRKGGTSVSRDRERMARIGRKGGEAVSKNREHMAAIARKGAATRNKAP